MFHFDSWQNLLEAKLASHPQRCVGLLRQCGRRRRSFALESLRLWAFLGIGRI